MVRVALSPLSIPDVRGLINWVGEAGLGNTILSHTFKKVFFCSFGCPRTKRDPAFTGIDSMWD